MIMTSRLVHRLAAAVLLLLSSQQTHAAAPTTRAPFGLRVEYLGAAPSDVAAPPPPPASVGTKCTAPDGSTVGGVLAEWENQGNTHPAAPLVLSCKTGAIARVEAFFGTPSGDCTAGFAKGTCDAPTAQAVVDAMCLHEATCSVPTATNESHWQGSGHPSPLAALFLPDPCKGTTKHLAVKVTCSGHPGAEPVPLLHGRSPLAPAAVPPPPSPALGIDAAKPRFALPVPTYCRSAASCTPLAN